MGGAKVIRLRCVAQEYAWGKKGKESKVASLAASADPSFALDEHKPYAELWMGTHPNAPSKDFESGQELGALLKQDASLMSEPCHKAYNGDLPFLLKVLSVNLALSIQAHPNKSLAEELFEKRPDVYKDPNHKPEMAIALTPFEALCGFRPLGEIAGFLEHYPEFCAVVGQHAAAQFASVAGGDQGLKEQKEALKVLFDSLMRADPEVVKKQLDLLVSRIAAMPGKEQDSDLHRLVRKLNYQFPGDVGCFCAFVLNYLTLQPGEAIFLAANLPHAYLSGDCVECMATSDNVVRAGLTPKLRDVDTLVSMLDYDFGPAEEFKISSKPAPGSTSSQVYDPPVPEFSVMRTSLAKGKAESFSGLKGPSILIAVEGKGTLKEGAGHALPLHHGHVYFIGADVPVEIASEDDSFCCYRALCDQWE